MMSAVMMSSGKDAALEHAGMRALPFDASLDDAFLRFHMDNPKVYERLVRKARAWRDAGHSHGSIKMFWESLRFDYGLEIGARGRFKLNNNHHSRYARLIMEREHDLAGFFETRELHTA